MKLLYLWVEKFRILSDLGLLFDGEYSISFDSRISELSISKADNYYRGLFSTKGIFDEQSRINVSILVGSDGSGKTTIASLINICCEGWLDSKFIMLWQEDDQIYGKSNGFQHPLVESGEAVKWVDRPPAFKVAYYSPHYHPLHNISFDNYDISTSHLLKNDVDLYSISPNKKKDYRDPVSVHNSMDYLRNGFFLSEPAIKKFRKSSKMVIPYGCLATFNNHEYRIFLDGIGSTNEYSFVKNVVTEFETEIKSQNDSKSVFIKTLCVRLLINYLRTNLGNFNAQEAGIENVVTATLNEVFNEYKKGGDNIEDSTKKFFKKILSVKLNYHGESLTYNEKISRPSIKFINSLREIPDSWFQKDGSLYFDLNPKNKSIESRTKRLELWNRFLALYFQTSSLSYYINLEWRPAISSGEYSHLNMYSRIFSIKEQLSNGSEGIILFLDEAEVTLHPEIQKALVNEMSLFCENIFPDKWIHIIFASHSPILLSDVPRRNAIFLKRDEHSVSISKDETPTFGANIYSLYKHPFFLERGLLGTFAESKINSLIRLVEEKKYLMRN